MDIGKEKPAIVVEPVEDPFEAKPAPAPDRDPGKEPAEPIEEPAKVEIALALYG